MNSDKEHEKLIEAVLAAANTMPSWDCKYTCASGHDKLSDALQELYLYRVKRSIEAEVASRKGICTEEFGQLPH
jgi:hypothetical protein